MKNRIWLIVLIGCSLVSFGLKGRAQPLTPGTMLGLSRDVDGTLTVNSVGPGGCPTRVCTTNVVTTTHCYTNCYYKLVCATNSAGQVQCTNILVCPVRCYTNTFPQITCTNEFLNPTTVIVHESLTGSITPNAGCDELDGLFPTNATFEAAVYANLRTNDWRGSHSGSFRILDGTNVVAYGHLSGTGGAGSHRGLEACAPCNHIEGTLQGLVTQHGALRYARIQASYSAALPGVACPSADVPQGKISLAIEGTVVTPCFSLTTTP